MGETEAKEKEMGRAYESRMSKIHGGLCTRRDLAPAAHRGFWQDRINQIRSWMDEERNGDYLAKPEMRDWFLRIEPCLAEFERMANM